MKPKKLQIEIACHFFVVHVCTFFFMLRNQFDFHRMADHGDIDLYADVDADFETGVADTGARYVITNY